MAQQKVIISDTTGMKIIQYRKQGITLDAISELTGISRTKCFEYLRQHGITLGRKRPGCEVCRREPYALGYCMKCYRRHRRLQGLD